MGRAQVIADHRHGTLERLFEGLTVEGFGFWFNVVHEGAEEESPVTSVGGQYGAKGGGDIILLQRHGDAYLDLVSGKSSACESATAWESALPWMVADGLWKEVRRRVVPRPESRPAGAGARR